MLLENTKQLMAQFGLVIKTKVFHKLDNMQKICSIPSKASDTETKQ